MENSIMDIHMHVFDYRYPLIMDIHNSIMDIIIELGNS